MRRLIVVCFVAVLGSVALAGPAGAQRDPFEPAIEEGATEEPVSGGAGEEQPAVEQPEPEPLAETGVEGKPWLALSYALVGLGTGLVLVTRFARPGSK